MNKVRVRFAPSPTGGLHLGGVRTALYNYLFAKKNGGDFILRIEDTDKKRFVEGAEEYINKCLDWCGIHPDEGPTKGGVHAPYRQSDRKHYYYQFAQQLIDDGFAYYAFDTPEELEKMRNRFKTNENPSPQYDLNTREEMNNSLSLPTKKVLQLLADGTPYVVRLKMPPNTTVSFKDMVRGEISFDTNLLDDKVLFKSDGLPTYHLAVVVDDHLMGITHVFRGEEWLSSTPVHLLLWKYLGWESQMPQWAHLPLILKPDGHGKLSKRDGERLGFPVFAMDWTDPITKETTTGFKERGFLPEAFINMLAVLGWNDGTEQELFTIEELVSKFSIEMINKAGAKFDFEKARWFNHQYIRRKPIPELAELVRPFIQEQGVQPELPFLEKVVELIRERCYLLTDFWEQGSFFFNSPRFIDTQSIVPKWNDEKRKFFESWNLSLKDISPWTSAAIEQHLMEHLENTGLKKGDVLLPLRVMLVGGKFGPAVFDIAALIGREETNRRIVNTLELL